MSGFSRAFGSIGCLGGEKKNDNRGRTSLSTINSMLSIMIIIILVTISISNSSSNSTSTTTTTNNNNDTRLYLHKTYKDEH